MRLEWIIVFETTKFERWTSFFPIFYFFFCPFAGSSSFFLICYEEVTGNFVVIVLNKKFFFNYRRHPLEVTKYFLLTCVSAQRFLVLLFLFCEGVSLKDKNVIFKNSRNTCSECNTSKHWKGWRKIRLWGIAKFTYTSLPLALRLRDILLVLRRRENKRYTGWAPSGKCFQKLLDMKTCYSDWF